MTGKQLRNSILQWAIQGKLVPQDPNDEPASVLLERIRAEKARLVKEKKIKKDKNETIIYRGEDNSYYEKTVATGAVRCIDDEIPFDIPQGWEWCRIKDVCSMQAGKNISASQIFSDDSAAHPYRCVGGNGLRGYVNQYNNSGHYAIIGRQGALCGCLNLENGDFYATEHAVVVDGYGLTSPMFHYYFLTALNLNQYATATAQPGLAVSNVLEVLFPLPPLAEQSRIIEKITGLLPKCDSIEAQELSLQKENSEIFVKLKSSILQEAIQGRLVPQIESEGTAEELLEEIRAEKQRLVKEGKLKKSALANESRIFRCDDNRYYEQIGTQTTEIQVPFDIPISWRWCRLHTIFILNMGQSPDGSSLSGDGIEFHQGKICFGNKYIGKSNVSTTVPTKMVPPNTILMCVRAPVGVLNITNREICIGRGLCGLINISDILDVDYWFYALSTYKGYYEDKATGSTFTAISSNIISNTLVPLPPLMEQRRIVEKIELIYSQLHEKV